MAENNETTCSHTRIAVPVRARRPILALGAELKSSVCLLRDDQAYLSADLGRLSEPDAFRRFQAVVDQMQRNFGRAERVACDRHPDYAATRYARSLGLPLSSVQHHHAHVVSGMVDAGLSGEVVGLACDGTGYGDDGTIWGCEILLCRLEDGACRRLGHLRTFPLLGGDAAAVETWRPAAGMVFDAFGRDWPDAAQRAFARVGEAKLDLARQRLGSPQARLARTSSLGRVFDAAAFLLGLCDRNDAEARAPQAVQAAAESVSAGEPLAWALDDGEDGAVIMDYRPMLRDLIEGLDRGCSAAETARAFHEALAAMLAAGVARACERAGCRRVLLTGGCFVNTLLLGRTQDALRSAGCEVFTHRHLSPGDSGVALGQAVVAAALDHKGDE